MVPCVFQPVPLLAGPHTSAHPASQRMRHLPCSVRLLRWTLVTRICGPPSAQPFLHVWPASRGPSYVARLHRARHAWRPCCLALCFVASLLNASPLAREGMWHGPAASPRPFVRSPCGMPVSASVPYKHISSPLGIRPVALAWLPVASFPLVSGCFLATAVRSVPLGLSQALSLIHI